jgi:predicted glycosyltransferase
MISINQKKRVVFYSQTLIGIGHLYRSLQIIHALVRDHEVYLIDGSRKVPGTRIPKTVNTIRLEPVYLKLSNKTNKHPIDQETSIEEYTAEDSTRNIADVFHKRRDVIVDSIREIQPDIFMIEYFPFARWAQRIEILPAIQAVRSQNGHVVCSVRDIPRRIREAGCFDDLSVHLQSKENQFFERLISTLNNYFDYLLVHGDQQVTRMEEHFPKVDDITIPIKYTGYVSEKLNGNGNLSYLKAAEDDNIDRKFVLVSAGGGREGFEIIAPCIDAWKSLVKRNLAGDREMVIFTGPYIPEVQYRTLERMCAGGPFRLGRFTSNFLKFMQAADFSISRAGYNTCMNILETHTRSLLIPSLPMNDQDFRARRLEKLGIVDVLATADLKPERIAELIRHGLSQSPIEHNISLDGGEETNEFLLNL